METNRKFSKSRGNVLKPEYRFKEKLHIVLQHWTQAYHETHIRKYLTVHVILWADEYPPSHILCQQHPDHIISFVIIDGADIWSVMYKGLGWWVTPMMRLWLKTDIIFDYGAGNIRDDSYEGQQTNLNPHLSILICWLLIGCLSSHLSW